MAEFFSFSLMICKAPISYSLLWFKLCGISDHGMFLISPSIFHFEVIDPHCGFCFSFLELYWVKARSGASWMR